MNCTILAGTRMSPVNTSFHNASGSRLHQCRTLVQQELMPAPVAWIILLAHLVKVLACTGNTAYFTCRTQPCRPFKELPWNKTSECTACAVEAIMLIF